MIFQKRFFQKRFRKNFFPLSLGEANTTNTTNTTKQIEQNQLTYERASITKSTDKQTEQKSN